MRHLPNLTDEQLAQQAQQGATDCLQTLIERHHRPLVGYLYRMVYGDQALAEDLAQESLIRMAIHLPQYQYPRRFKTWLYAIATNQARDYYRSAELRHTDAMPDDEPPTNDPWLENALIAQDEAARALAGLARLPEKQREAIVLFYYQELSLAELAEALDVPIGTVKSRLSLGIKQLRQWAQSAEAQGTGAQDAKQ